MVTFSHTDAGTDEAAWAGSALAGIGELPLGPDELAGTTFILLAAHPDDESLGAGGLLAQALRSRRRRGSPAVFGRGSVPSGLSHHNA